MASATGLPEAPVTHEAVGEDEPLLGRAGDASQQRGKPLYYNLIIGTAPIAQVGLILLVASIWASVFLSPLMLFSAHPLLNSAGLLLLAETVLILQPTHTPTQKRQGTLTHASVGGIGVTALVAGLIVIEYNKISHSGAHFQSPHAILGLITSIIVASQTVVGFTQYFVPQLYGGVDNAKAVYKWHRMSGYLILFLMLATIAAATQTDFNKNVLDIKLWAVIVTALLVIIGIAPRIKKQKLGLA